MKRSRNVVVFGTLTAAVAGMCVLLLALSPAPLSPDAQTLLASDSPSAFVAIFQTRANFEAQRWASIYIHHSKTAAGDAASFAQSPQGPDDHFIIGNGDGCGDGEIQMAQRWLRQTAASGLKDGCVSICLVGNFDQSAPTAQQLRRLEQLIQALRGRCQISPDDIYLADQADSTAGIGRLFPASAFRQQLQR